MVDEVKRPLFGTAAQPTTDSNKPESEVSQPEADALKGDGGPGLTPAFGKQAGQDENNNLTNVDQLDSLKDGAAAQSGTIGEGGLDIPGLVAAQGVGAEAPEDGSTQYVSTIARLRLGKFEFANGQLSLGAEDASRFEKLLETAHPRSKAAVRKIDRRAGEVVARRLAGSMSRGVDTSDNGPQSPKPSA